MGRSFVVKWDALDIRLLTALTKGKKRTNRALADYIGLSESACHTRLQRMEKSGVIRGYKAIAAFERLGFFHAWLDVTLTDENAATFAEFESLALKCPEVVAVFIVDGACHFRLETAAEDFNAWQAFAQRLIDRADLVVRVERRCIYKVCGVPTLDD